MIDALLMILVLSFEKNRNQIPETFFKIIPTIFSYTYPFSNRGDIMLKLAAVHNQPQKCRRITGFIESRIMGHMG